MELSFFLSFLDMKYQLGLASKTSKNSHWRSKKPFTVHYWCTLWQNTTFCSKKSTPLNNSSFGAKIQIQCRINKIEFLDKKLDFATVCTMCKKPAKPQKQSKKDPRAEKTQLFLSSEKLLFFWCFGDFGATFWYHHHKLQCIANRVNNCLENRDGKFDRKSLRKVFDDNENDEAIFAWNAI